jgi:hypothetical protein
MCVRVGTSFRFHFNSEAAEGFSPAYHEPVNFPYHINFYDSPVQGRMRYY